LSSLRSLAKSLNLSITTVSRALDGYSDVSEATRLRVREAAEASGYTPNAAARRLRKGTTEVVMLILPAEPGHFNEPLYIGLLASMGERLAVAGYDLMLFAAPPGPDELRAYRKVVEGRRADAVVVVRTRRDDPRVRYLAGADFPFVVMGRTEFDQPYAFVDGDGETAFAYATKRLIALGHRRITHLAAPSAFTFAGYRRRGYERAMAGAGLEPDVIEDAHAQEGGYRGALAALLRPARPTALLCATDSMAIGALQAARTLDLDVPADLSVIGHDNLPAGEHTHPPLTTMELPIAETGRVLAEMVLARMAGDDPAEISRILPVRFVERGSMGPAPV
jgi:LacI family transcriptional regulator